MKVLLGLIALLLVVVVYFNRETQSPMIESEPNTVLRLSQEMSDVDQLDLPEPALGKEAGEQLSPPVINVNSGVQSLTPDLDLSSDTLQAPIGEYDIHAVAPEDESVQPGDYDPMIVSESDALAPEFGSENMPDGESLPMLTEENDDGKGLQDSTDKP
jgi:hypothetical protein